MTLIDIIVNYALKYQLSLIETENMHLKLWKKVINQQNIIPQNGGP